jgi:hypothetical protein
VLTGGINCCMLYGECYGVLYVWCANARSGTTAGVALYKIRRVGQNHTHIHKYGVLSREITLHIAIYGVNKRFWPILEIRKSCADVLCAAAASSEKHLVRKPPCFPRENG